MKSLSVIVQMKATEQYFSVVLFFHAVQNGSNLESVDVILKFDHSKMK